MDTLLLVDGNAIMHRAYHAIPNFKTKSGRPTNVIYGFFAMLQRATDMFQPTHLVICFDTPAKTFREKMLPTYQSQRPKISDDFIQQIPVLKDLITTAGIVQAEKEGFEADDVIGTLSLMANKEKMKVLILTGDKDIMQLVNDNTFIVSPQTGMSTIKVYNPEEVEKKMGVAPERIADLKALIGDPSDNYKGVDGIGPKTAIKLLTKYGSVDGIVAKSDELSEDEKKQLELSHVISTIVRDVPLDITIDETQFLTYAPALEKKFEELEMKSLRNRFFHQEKTEKPKKKAPAKYEPMKKAEEDPQIGLF
jgi:DNA polymerase I